MSGFKETNRVYHQIIDTQKPLSTVDFGIDIKAPYIPYPHMKQLIYAFSAACMDEFNIPSRVEAGIDRRNTGAFMLFATKPDTPTFPLYTIVAKDVRYGQHISQNGQVEIYAANKDGTFDEHIFALGEVAPPHERELQKGLTFSEAVGQFCAFSISESITSQQGRVSKLARQDWRFRIFQQLLNHPGLNDDSFVSVLLNEHNGASEWSTIFEGFKKQQLAQEAWVKEYIAILANGNIEERLAHIHKVFPETQETLDVTGKYDELRKKLRSIFNTGMRKKDICKFQATGTGTASKACHIGLKHLAQAAYLEDQLENADFISMIESHVGASDGIDSETFRAYLPHVVARYRNPSNSAPLSHVEESIVGKIGFTLWKDITDKARDDKSFIDYVEKVIPQLAHPTLQMARTTHQEHADDALEALKTKKSAFQTGVFDMERHRYTAKTLHTYTSTVAHLGCLNLHSHVTNYFIHLYQQQMTKSFKAARKSGVKII